ncbi:MAG TPA: T9SS type A sorting domain-containing protein [Candidatus Krumholzibacteria bacterium]|nr:T9SS type A sorting domain-containing protein [Candidatus Krumholzibacteria bacterium]
MRLLRPFLFLSVLILGLSSTAKASTTVFFTDFTSGMPAEFTAPGCVIDGVQGYNGLGPVGNQFGGNFLHFTSVPLSNTTLTLSGLPAHDHLSLAFLAAIIDSWDGTELFKVSIDGTEVFSHWFQLALGDNSDYVAPAGGLLSSGTNLGFTGGGYYDHDRAYNMGVDPVFTVAHTASTVTIVWSISAISGPAADQWQGGIDESWAIDNVKVSVSSTVSGVGDTPAASAITLLPNSPNPFSDVTRFRMNTPGAGSAHVDVFDISGRRVAEHVVPATGGMQDLYFDGRDTKGNQLPSGVYFYRLTVGTQSRTQKFVIMR